MRHSDLSSYPEEMLEIKVVAVAKPAQNDASLR